MDTLASALNAIKTSEERGETRARIRPASRLVKQVLLILQAEKYVGDFEFVDDGKSGEFSVSLVGKVNDLRVIKPRFSVKLGEWEKFEERFLPARDVGIIISSTPKGILTHKQAKKKGLGGRLLCYVY